MDMDIAFSQSYMNNFMINITPDGEEPTWARLGAGISSAEPEGNEEIDQSTYYDGEGLASSDVTGGQMVITFSGNRCIGDPAQDFIAARKMDYGSARKTDMRWINPEGDVLEGKITLANIKIGGGDANAKETFEFEAHFNGRPAYKVGNKTEFPEKVECEAVSVAVGAAVKANVTVTPSDGASDNVFFAIDDRSIATVDADGTVHGIKQGETELTVKSAVLPSVSANVKVTVSAA